MIGEQGTRYQVANKHTSKLYLPCGVTELIFFIRKKTLCTNLPARRVDFERFSREHEVELSAGAVLVTHAREQAPELEVYSVSASG